MFGTGDTIPQNYDGGETKAAKAKGVKKPLMRGDVPIIRRDTLPTKPAIRPRFDTLAAFMNLAKDAYALGIVPPTEPTPEAIMQWKTLASPRVEEQILNKVTPGKYFKGRGDTWGI